MHDTEILSLLLKSRLFEEKIDEEFRRGNLYGTTHLSIGQEASHTGLCLALEKGDFFVPTHRCHGFNVASGSDIYSMFSEMLGSRHGLCKGLGGSMHMTDLSHGNLGSSAVVGSGIPLALGASYALSRQKKENIAAAVFGDGASSRGTLHEAMNLSSVWNLPVLFFMENNHYGMSASSERMISTSSVASRSSGYNIGYRSIDGNDYDAVYEAVRAAREYILENRRPFFIETNTYRQCGHSKSDRLLYRNREEENEWKDRDPIHVYVERHGITQEEYDSVLNAVRAEIGDAWERAWRDRNDVLSLDEAKAFVVPPAEEAPVCVNPAARHSATYREAVREALGALMKNDERVSLIGEDIGVYGGCFGVTGDLYRSYSSQMMETPVSEETFTGMAVGASLTGERPIVEIMYGDFLTLASDPVINHGAKSSFMSAGALRCPVIIRTAMGGGTGHGAQHTQCLENLFLSVPGLRVVAPSDALTAKALLLSAGRENCPVIFLEHKALYGDSGYAGDDDYALPLGKVIVSGSGSSVLVIGYSRPFALARKVLPSSECTFLDIASLRPLDEDGIREYASRFERIMIVEDTPLQGSAAESVIRCIREANISCMIVTVTAEDMPLAFTRRLEGETLVSECDILSAYRRLRDER